MDKLYLKDVEIFANHGVFNEEKSSWTKIYIIFRVRCRFKFSI